MVYIPASTLAGMYPVIAGSALLMALVIGLRTSFELLTQTHCQTAEYWPSVSATIGDVFAGRVLWRIALLIAFLPRAASSYFMYEQYSAISKPSGSLPSAATVMWFVDIIRVGSGVGWTVVSSPESVAVHELCFGVYLVSGFVLHILQTYLAGKAAGTHPNGPLSYRLKAGLLASETTCTLLVVKFFIDHVTYCTAGLYSRATMAEWGFVICNLAFDATQVYDLPNKGIFIGDADRRERSPTSTTPFIESSSVQWLIDIFFGFQLFSFTLQLYQSVYYVPMVAMQFTPEVVFVLAPLVTFIWYFRPAERILTGRIAGVPTYAVLYAISAIGYLTFDINFNPGNRIIFFGIAVGATVLAFYTRMFYSAEVDYEDLSRIAFSLPLGCVMSMCLRLLHTGLDPFHTEAVYNVFGFVGCLLGAYFMKRPSHRSSPEQLPGGPTQSQVTGYTPWAAGAAFGSVCALSVPLITNGGLVGRYVALAPFPSAVFVCLAMLAGLALSSTLPRRLYMVLFLQIGGFLVFNFSTIQTNRLFEQWSSPTRPTGYATDVKAIDIKNWSVEEIQGSNVIAFIGALMMVFGLGACWPIVSEYCLIPYRAGRNKAKTTILGSFEFAASVSQLVTLMMHVYVVCFPFMPGGFIFRDRIQIPYIVTFILLTVSLIKCVPRTDRTSRIAQLPVMVFGSLMLLLGGCAIVRVALAPPTAAPGNSDPLKAEVTSLLWTIHFGLDDYGVDSTHRLVDMVRKEQPGIVGILESDTARVMNGNRDIMESLGYYLGLEHEDYGPTTFDGTFGCALVTKYPIHYVRRYAMPSPVGEIACLIHARLEIAGVLVNVYVGHWGNTDHVPDRILQSQFLGSLARANPGPSIFMGYLTTNPDLSTSHFPLYASPESPENANGRFRDTGYTMWKERKWERTDTNGYRGNETEPGVAEWDVDYRREPPGSTPRSFYFSDTKITTHTHPRLEYLERYCQYTLYKTGHPSEEASPALIPTSVMQLHHYYRVLDVKHLSDTEIMVSQYVFVPYTQAKPL